MTVASAFYVAYRRIYSYPQVPATLYQSRDIDLMNLLHANGKGAKIISRTTLLAVCEFRQIPGEILHQICFGNLKIAAKYNLYRRIRL